MQVLSRAVTYKYLVHVSLITGFPRYTHLSTHPKGKDGTLDTLVQSCTQLGSLARQTTTVILKPFLQHQQLPNNFTEPALEKIIKCDKVLSLPPFQDSLTKAISDMNTIDERNQKRPRESDSTLSPPPKKVQHKSFSSTHSSCEDERMSPTTATPTTSTPTTATPTPPHPDTTVKAHSPPTSPFIHQDKKMEELPEEGLERGLGKKTEIEDEEGVIGNVYVKEDRLAQADIKCEEGTSEASVPGELMDSLTQGQTDVGISRIKGRNEVKREGITNEKSASLEIMDSLTHGQTDTRIKGRNEVKSEEITTSEKSANFAIEERTNIESEPKERRKTIESQTSGITPPNPTPQLTNFATEERTNRESKPKESRTTIQSPITLSNPASKPTNFATQGRTNTQPKHNKRRTLTDPSNLQIKRSSNTPSRITDSFTAPTLSLKSSGVMSVSEPSLCSTQAAQHRGSPQHTGTAQHSTEGTQEHHRKKKNKKHSSQDKYRKISGETKNLRPNYFVGIQISNPEIHRGLLKVQEDLVSGDEGLVRSLVDVATSHITLLVAHLHSHQDIVGASAALEESVVRMKAALTHNPLCLTFSGVSHFNNQVVFARVLEDQHHHRLLALAECVRQVFLECGVCMPDTRDLHPHLTIAKLSKAPRTKGKHPVLKKIDLSYYRHHLDLHFGSQTVAGLQLLSMNKAKDQQRYYHSDKQILFDIKIDEEKDHSRCCFPRQPKLPHTHHRHYSTTTTTTTTTTTPPAPPPTTPPPTTPPTTTPPTTTTTPQEEDTNTWLIPLARVTTLVAAAMLLGFALARVRGNN